MTFAKKLINARLALNLSQQELGEQIGVSSRTIYSYEHGGKYPRRNTLDKLAAALHVTAAYLMNEEEEDTQRSTEQERFLSKSRKDFGYKGARDAEKFIEQASVLFAGGELDEESKDLVFQSLTEIYFESKAAAREKFTPRRVKRRCK
jgi:transcriptional regulator with XRE-family HTH domain